MPAWLQSKHPHVPAAQARGDGETACFGHEQVGAAGNLTPSRYGPLKLLDVAPQSGTDDTLDHQLLMWGLQCSRSAKVFAAVAPAPPVVHLQAVHLS